MSILIKGMEMPKDCVSCRWHASWGCEITGIVTNTAGERLHKEAENETDRR